MLTDPSPFMVRVTSKGSQSDKSEAEAGSGPGSAGAEELKETGFRHPNSNKTVKAETRVFTVFIYNSLKKISE
jgi:hypothetical protein